MNELNFVNIPEGTKKEILKVMANKVAIVNRYKYEGYTGNFREFPIFSELKGMEQMLKIMDVDWSYEYDPTVVYITGIYIGDLYIKID